MEQNHAYYPHISIDCVLLGFDGEELKVLLVERTRTDDGYSRYKLPGRLIFENEELDSAAHGVLRELTGIDAGYLRQFKAFGSPNRTDSPEDVLWLENAVKLKIGRIVTIGYMALVRITNDLREISPEYKAVWCPVDKIPPLAFDHNQIIEEALSEVATRQRLEPAMLFELLPVRFTANQLRRLYEVVLGKEMDVRNFYKKINTIPYIVQLEERETNVSHRAARYFRFDRKKYSKFMTINK